MCGRFDLHSEPTVILKEFGIGHFSAEYSPSYNIAPSRQIIVVKEDRKRHLSQCRWGLIPSWADDPKIGDTLINARAETVADKPAFSDAFRSQRCLVVADGFYEWIRQGKTRQPVYVRLKSRSLMAFAGLYNVWTSPEGDKICTCAIITTDANELLMPVHDRMPVIVAKDKEDLWLDPLIKDRQQLMPLLVPYPADEMEFYPVSSSVNKPDYDSPDAIIPVDSAL